MAWFLKDLITNSPSTITGNPPNVSPKPVAPDNTVIVDPMGKSLKTLLPSNIREGASPSKVILVKLLQLSKADGTIVFTLLGSRC